MALAVLSIDLEARIAKLEADMGKATRVLAKTADDAKAHFASIRDVFAGSLLAGAVREAAGQIGRLVPDLLEGAARFQDLSEETNASAEQLSRFQLSADVAGVSVRDMANFSIKLSTNLAKVDDEGKGAAAGLRALGLNVAEFRKLDPSDKIVALSKAFNSFADSESKTAIAMALFNRGGAQVLRFFKEFGDGSEQSVRFTKEQIEAADEYLDRQARTRSEFRKTAEALAIAAIPAFNALGNAAVTVFKRFGDVGQASRDLKAETSFLDFFEGAAIAVATVGEAVFGLLKAIRAIGGSFQAVAADLSFVKDLPGLIWGAVTDFEPGRQRLMAALENRNKVVREANERYVDLWNYDGTAVTKAIRESFAKQRELLANPPAKSAPDTRPKLAPFSLVDDKEQAAAEGAFANLMKQIAERRAAAVAELDTGEKLNESQRFAIQVTEQLAKATAKLTPEQKATAAAALDEYLAIAKAAEAQAESVKLRQADSRALAQDLQQRDQINRTLAEEIEQIGLTAAQIEDLKIRRLDEALARKEQTIAAAELLDADASAIGQMRLIADALRDEIALRRKQRDAARALASDPQAGVARAANEFLEATAKKGDAVASAVSRSTAALEDDLTSSLRRGTLSVRSFADIVIDELLRINVVKPALAWLLGDGAGGGGFLRSAFSWLFSAQGNAFVGGSVRKFADGGIFGANGGLMTAPTVFRTASGWGVGGEAGTEGVLPLARTRSGKLGVQTTGAPANQAPPAQALTQVFQIGAGVTRPEVQALLQAWGQRIKGEILTSMNNRGAFARGG